MNHSNHHGDEGNTRLFGGRQVAKDDERIEAHGAVDELNATIGLARVSPLPVALDTMLERIQSDLFDLAAELVTPRDDEDAAGKVLPFPPAALEAVEGFLTSLEERLPPTSAFLLPGGHHAAALLGVCRTQCRRAERRVVSLARHERISGVVLKYLNRLSDLFFVMARDVNTSEGMPEPEWQPREVREAEDQ
ncbi:MAG: ATP:cob(I)alamin adenosyltransferase [Planctomycetes bacterium]|jgi:cob(I)alamin adenosyltransferase|nr:ATP:cob(I)alamin adenosyltransferase [Planctomycetota bacterium]